VCKTAFSIYEVSHGFCATPELLVFLSLSTCYSIFCSVFVQLFRMLHSSSCVLVAYGPWQDHVCDYWDHRHDKNVLILFYEDLHQVVYLVL